MKTEKKLRSDNTYMLSNESFDNPKLGAKVLHDGRESLFLDHYLGYTKAVSTKTHKEYKRVNLKREYLKLYLYSSPRNADERQHNKETLHIAKRIRQERAQDMLDTSTDYNVIHSRNMDLMAWYDSYVDVYTKSDKDKLIRARQLFVECMSKTPRLAHLANKITPRQMTPEVIRVFTDFLVKKFNGETPHTLYSRFKKVILAAVENEVLRRNPCKGITIKVDKNKLTKEILSSEEITRLVATRFNGENHEVRRAFIFCLYCGMRWCDVKDLTYSNVDYSNRLLKFEQSKTKGHSAASGVVIPLNEGLLKLIGDGSRDELIFKLPSHNYSLRMLRKWTECAGIKKHITWHCGRHSFATNILSNGANIKTVASLLGHSDLRHTEKYVRAVDALKEAAINSLPQLDFTN